MNKSNPKILRGQILSANFVFGRFVSKALKLREFVLLTLHFIGKKITHQAWKKRKCLKFVLLISLLLTSRRRGYKTWRSRQMSGKIYKKEVFLFPVFFIENLWIYLSKPNRNISSNLYIFFLRSIFPLNISLFLLRLVCAMYISWYYKIWSLNGLQKEFTSSVSSFPFLKSASEIKFERI